MKAEAELKEAVVAAAIKFHQVVFQGGSMSVGYAEDALHDSVKALLKSQGKQDPGIKGADLLTRAGLLEAAENGAELGTCDED